MRLEQRVIRMERVCLLIVILAGIVFFTAAQRQRGAAEVLRVRKLELVRADGSVVGVLDDDLGTPRLLLYDGDKKTAVSAHGGVSVSHTNLGRVHSATVGHGLIQITHRLPIENVTDASSLLENTETSVQIGSFDSNAGYVVVYNALGEPAAKLAADKANGGLVLLYDATGNIGNGMTWDKR